MSTAQPRRALFNRVFALSRKAARGERPSEHFGADATAVEGGGEVEQDQEGFEDLDKYFAPSPHPVRTLAPVKASPGAGVVASSERDMETEVGLATNGPPASPSPMMTMTVEDGMTVNMEDVDMTAAPLNEDYDMHIDEEVSIKIKKSPKAEKKSDGPENDDDDDDENAPPTPANINGDLMDEGEHNTSSQKTPKNLVLKKSAPRKAPMPKTKAVRKTPATAPSRSTAVAMPAANETITTGETAQGETGGNWYQELLSKQRPKRNRIPPLAYWKNEKVVYGRRLSSKIPVIVGVVRKEDDDEDIPIAASASMKKKISSSTKKTFITRQKSKRKPDAELVTDASSVEEEAEVEQQHQQQQHQQDQQQQEPKSKKTASIKKELRDSGFKKNVSFRAMVMDYDQHQEVERLVAVSEDKLEPAEVKGEKFKIQTVFGEGSFLSSGILVFPPDSVKPTRNSSKYALVFYVIEGTVDVTVHTSNFVIGTGGQFIIPRGNQYSIRSVWKEGDSRLFFCHCKDTSA